LYDFRDNPEAEEYLSFLLALKFQLNSRTTWTFALLPGGALSNGFLFFLARRYADIIGKTLSEAVVQGKGKFMFEL
jgi:hypothetical protein